MLATGQGRGHANGEDGEPTMRIGSAMVALADEDGVVGGEGAAQIKAQA